MAAKVRQKGEDWYVFVNHGNQRRAKQVGPGAAGKKLADQLAKQWNASLTLGNVEAVFPVKVAPVVAVGALPTVREALPEWLERREKLGDIRAASRQAYQSAVKTWVLPEIGDVRVDQVTEEQVGALIEKIKLADKSKSTVSHVLKALKPFFRRLVKTKKITVNPTEDLSDYVGTMKGRKEIVLFTKDEMKILKRAAKATDPRLYPFLEMAFGTGGRWSELAALTKNDVDLKARDGMAGQVTFNKGWSRNSRKLEFTKTEKADIRTVPLSKELVAILKDWMATRSAEGWGEQALVFPGPNGRHMATWGERWLRLLKKAGIKPHRPFKATRNCFASYALLGGARPENVQRWLGHATLSMTLDTYRQFIPVHEADARDAARLGDLIGC
jgi:integrase